MSTTTVELSRASAISSGPGTWDCQLVPGLSLRAGQHLTVSDCYINVPGSSQTQQGFIRLDKDYTHKIVFGYLTEYNTILAADPNSPMTNAYMANVDGSAPSGFAGDTYYLSASNAPLTRDKLVVDFVEVTILAGDYTPAGLAASLSSQLGALTPQTIGSNTDSPHLPPEFLRSSINTGTLRGQVAMDGTDYGALGTWTSLGGRYGITTSSGNSALYAHGCNSPTVVWSEERNEFQFKYLHSVYVDSAGTPSLAKIYNMTGTTPPYAFDWLGRFTGITVLSFVQEIPGPDRQSLWSSTLWSALGFDYSDLEGPASTGLGLSTRNVLDAETLAVTNYKQNPQRYILPDFIAMTAIILVALGDNDTTDGPYASRSPDLISSDTPYWRVNLSCAATTWLADSGQNQFNAVATANKSFASQDTYTGFTATPVLITQDMDVGLVRVSIVDPSTNLPDPNVGGASMIKIVVQ